MTNHYSMYMNSLNSYIGPMRKVPLGINKTMYMRQLAYSIAERGTTNLIPFP